jgi:ubiquinone/menaquinone biosynthesis C-methylase UbiE
MELSEYGVMYRLEQSYWWFVGKQFLVREQVKPLLMNRGTGARILDIGSGTGIILKTLEEFGQAFGMERSQEAIQFLKKRSLKRIVCSDAEQVLPFKDGSFTLVTCLDVLEHLDHDRALLTEMIRVCKEGGYILVTAPAYNRLWSPHDSVLRHRRRYTRTRLLGQLSGMKAQVLKASYYNFMLSLPILAVRKLRSLFSEKGKGQSDFFIDLPEGLNRSLSALYKLEILGLRILRYPYGVSLLVLLRKPYRERKDA